MRCTSSFAKSLITCATACLQTFAPGPAFAHAIQMVKAPSAIEQITVIEPYAPDQNALELYRLRQEIARSDVVITTAAEVMGRRHHPRLAPQ